MFVVYNDTRKQDRQNGQNKLEYYHGKEKKFYTRAKSKSCIGGSTGRKNTKCHCCRL